MVPPCSWRAAPQSQPLCTTLHLQERTAHYTPAPDRGARRTAVCPGAPAAAAHAHAPLAAVAGRATAELARRGHGRVAQLGHIGAVHSVAIGSRLVPERLGQGDRGQRRAGHLLRACTQVPRIRTLQPAVARRCHLTVAATAVARSLVALEGATPGTPVTKRQCPPPRAPQRQARGRPSAERVPSMRMLMLPSGLHRIV